MKDKNFSRRNFFKLAGLAAGSTAIALTPKKALGWMSFEFAKKNPVWDAIGFNDPLHEDSIQFAYSIVLQRHKNHMSAGQGPKSILNPAHKYYSKKNYSVNQYFLENFKMLRYGAYWNDAAAFELLDYLPSVIWKNDILEWRNKKAPYYENLLDIAEHLVQNHNREYNAFIQFNANGRLDCLHGMLNTYSDGDSKSEHISQAQNKELIMQWFESAYKFAIEGETYPDSNIRYFFDTNNQYFPNLDKKMLIDDSASFIDTDNTKYNTRQLRLRVLGMICHTIQDLWNPAHTIRSYYKDKNNKDRFGSILAFGDYSKQNRGLGANNHKPYDSCAHIDPKWKNKDLRDILIDETTPHQGAPERAPIKKDNYLKNILNWNGLKYSKNINIEDACRQFNTLGLKYTIKYLSDFLEIAYLGLKWSGQPFFYNTDIDYHDNPVSIKAHAGFVRFNSVEDWFNNFVLKDMFDIYGNSYIYNSGIKTTLSEYEILPFVEGLSEVIESHFDKGGEALINLLTNLVDIHSEYTDLAIKFYSNHNTNGSDYLQDNPECMAKTAQNNLFNCLTDILLKNDCSFKKMILPDIDSFLADLQIDQYASWNNLVDLVCGFLQELYLEIDENHNINSEICKLCSRLKGKDTNIWFSGFVENAWEHKDEVYFQIRSENNKIICFVCNKSQIDNHKDLIIGAENIKVNCDLSSSFYKSGIYVFSVNNVIVPPINPDNIPNYFIRAKIDEVAEKNIKATVLDFSDEKTSTYVFELEKKTLLLEKDYEYLLTYKAFNNKLICIDAKKYDSEKDKIERHSSQIIHAYSNCLEYLVKTPLPEEIKTNEVLLESDLIYYDDAQICGSLNKDENFESIFLNNNLSDKSNSNNIGYGYKRAIRIKSDNYNKDNSMDFYIPAENGTHIKTDKKLCSSVAESCTFKDGKCIYCGNRQNEKHDNLPINPLGTDAQTTTPNTSDNNGAYVAAAVGTAAIGASSVVYKSVKESDSP